MRKHHKTGLPLMIGVKQMKTAEERWVLSAARTEMLCA